MDEERGHAVDDGPKAGAERAQIVETEEVERHELGGEDRRQHVAQLEARARPASRSVVNGSGK